MMVTRIGRGVFTASGVVRLQLPGIPVTPLAATPQAAPIGAPPIPLTTGMRQGELLGLRWRDVNLDTGSLSIRLSHAAVEALRRHNRPYFPLPNCWQLVKAALWNLSPRFGPICIPANPTIKYNCQH